MIELLDSPPHVLAYRISGTIDAEDYDAVIAALDAKLATHPRIGVFADMAGFTDMTAGAWAKDIRYHMGHFGDWSRFPRCAVVTDKQWLRVMVQWLDPLFPQFEAKVFAPGEEAQAMAWVADFKS